MDGGQWVTMKRSLTAAERRAKRATKKKETKRTLQNPDGPPTVFPSTVISTDAAADERFSRLISKNEDDLLNFVAQVNKLYQEKLKKPAPFMTFIFVGMQSAGKSTIMERFMNAVLNIVQEGTGTRCPLDTTCIHDDSCTFPVCDLYGEDLATGGGEQLSVEQVFAAITDHNKRLGGEDVFSTNPLILHFRSKHVQNMRFVDTPGIITNKSTGKDNRQDIKKILKSEMNKPNTKLCVLLEPKEFATNAVVDFCDESLGGRAKWFDKATFLMTKFDKQLDDARTASKANGFFTEFAGNRCFPHLVITPTLAKEKLPPAELYKARQDLVASSNDYEKDRFDEWLDKHEAFRQEDGDDTALFPWIRPKIGFLTAKTAMREIMLHDTVKRLPEVLSDLRKRLNEAEKERKVLLELRQFNDPLALKLVVQDLLFHVCGRVTKYLDGDLESTLKFPEKLQTLDDELLEEEESDWANKELNHFSEFEDTWRDRIADMEGDYHDCVQSDSKFLGGKQCQRAIAFFGSVLIDALPNPYDLKEYVRNSTGYMGGNLLRENWEGAMVQTTRMCMKEISHPGVNFLVKHIGVIFRRLFAVALDDIKQGERFSSQMKLLPLSVEKFLIHEFDEMLWELMSSVSEKSHDGLEPMYSTVDPTLPTFHIVDDEKEDMLQAKYILENNQYVLQKAKSEMAQEGIISGVKRNVSALMKLAGGSGSEAKALLKEENEKRATSKKNFLSDERTSMITSEEADKILKRCFQYIVALMEFLLFIIKCQVNHHLVHGFKSKLTGGDFVKTVLNKAEWDDLVEPDPEIELRLENLEENITGLQASLADVHRMQRSM